MIDLIGWGVAILIVVIWLVVLWKVRHPGDDPL